MAAPIADDIDAKLRNYHTAAAGLTNGVEMGRKAGYSTTWWSFFLPVFVSWLVSPYRAIR